MSTLTAQEKKERASSAAVSIGVHVALLLLFLFWQLHNNPIPVEEDGGGILVNFGDSETGLGDVEPMSKDVSVPTPPQPQNTPPQKVEEVVTQDNEPAPSINTTKTKKPKVDDVKTKTVATTPVVTPPVEKPKQPKALFPGNTTNSSTSQGDNVPGGNKGKTYGDKNTNGNSDIGGGSNPLGTGGPGIGFSLSGRSMTKRPTIEDKSQKTGKVVVKIKVDKNGNVVSATATHMGSTTEDSYLYNLAEKAAFQTKFNASADMIEQFGTMTFTFKVK
jgi:hypothetical protein